MNQDLAKKLHFIAYECISKHNLISYRKWIYNLDMEVKNKYGLWKKNRLLN